MHIYKQVLEAPVAQGLDVAQVAAAIEVGGGPNLLVPYCGVHLT